MKLTQSFDVPEALDEVAIYFRDVPAVASCMPGVDVAAGDAPDTYRGRLVIRLGPMSFTFEGEANVSVAADQRSGVIEGTGIDRRGGSRATATVTYRLAPATDGTHVDIETDIALAGAVAQFGRTGLIKDVSDRLVGQFATCVAARLSGDDEANAAPAELRPLPLIATSLKDGAIRQAKRLGSRRTSDAAPRDE